MFTLLPYQQRALDAVQTNRKGSVFVPTGGGKTVIMMEDAKQRIARASKPLTFLIVAPRILLANQLCGEFEEYLDNKDIHYMHCHSGETHHFKSTNPELIKLFANTAKVGGEHCFIFTTYNSIHKVNDQRLTLMSFTLTKHITASRKTTLWVLLRLVQTQIILISLLLLLSIMVELNP